MNIKILETSLNLRFERGKKNKDYILSKAIAMKQLEVPDVDIYCNVEYMRCTDDEYLHSFKKAGYNAFTAVDEKGRGILCEIKNEYEVTTIEKMNEPHMLHLHISKDNTHINLITVRLLVAGGDEKDFKNRKGQWDKIVNYIESLKDKSNLIVTGDFNHGVINNDGNYFSKPREFYNYQMVLIDLYKRNVKIYPISGNSYRGYMKIDHIATGKKIEVINAKYKDMFDNINCIGIPDHSCIVAELNCA